MLDADAVINNSAQKAGGSNAYPDQAPEKVGGSGPRKTHRIYAPDCTEPTTKSGKNRETKKLKKVCSEVSVNRPRNPWSQS